jgi:integrase/recombinase XerD
MQSSIQTVSPLRQRMLEDMRMCHLVPKTQSAYIRAVGKLAQFFGRSPDTADAEELCRFQLHLVDEGTSPITLNATITVPAWCTTPTTTLKIATSPWVRPSG